MRAVVGPIDTVLEDEMNDCGVDGASAIFWVEAFELSTRRLGKVVFDGDAAEESICPTDASALDVTDDAISAIVDGPVVVSIGADDETVVVGTSMHTVSCVRLHACDMYFPSLQTLQFMQSKSPSLSGPHVPTANVTPAAH